MENKFIRRILDESQNWLGNEEPVLENRQESGAGSCSSLVKRTNIADITLITTALNGSTGTVASVANSSCLYH